MIPGAVGRAGASTAASPAIRAGGERTAGVRYRRTVGAVGWCQARPFPDGGPRCGPGHRARGKKSRPRQRIRGARPPARCLDAVVGAVGSVTAGIVALIVNGKVDPLADVSTSGNPPTQSVLTPIVGRPVAAPQPPPVTDQGEAPAGQAWRSAPAAW